MRNVRPLIGSAIYLFLLIYAKFVNSNGLSISPPAPAIKIGDRNNIFPSSAKAPAPSLPLPSNNCPVVPRRCPNPNIRFFLYTRSNPTIPVELSVVNLQTIIEAKFSNGSIKIIIHGYNADKDQTPNIPIRPEYFKDPLREINVISVDYHPLVKDGCYLTGVQNTIVVGNCTAQFVDALLRIRPEIKLSQIHFIGLSLGAQVAGSIAQFLKSGRPKRITALDAALVPYPSPLTDFMTIRKGEADFIDALHTNAGIIGQFLPYGDCDFYANGGTLQPGCSPLVGCRDLGRGPKVYYGEYVDPTRTRGTYFFKTGAESP